MILEHTSAVADDCSYRLSRAKRVLTCVADILLECHDMHAVHPHDLAALLELAGAEIEAVHQPFEDAFAAWKT